MEREKAEQRFNLARTDGLVVIVKGESERERESLYEREGEIVCLWEREFECAYESFL